MGAPGTAALRQKSVRVFGDGASDRWGRPGTTAVRQKSVRVFGDGASDRWGRPGTGRAPTEELSCIRGWGFCSKGAAEDGRATTALLYLIH